MKNLLICLHCGGMPFDAKTLETKSLGGSETAALYMAEELSKLGHEVRIFTNQRDPASKSGGPKYNWAGPVSEAEPLGKDFHFWAANTPHDVLIVQRHPQAFKFQYASKMNFLWLHDLALYRNAEQVNTSLYNIDGVLCVSEYHKNQVAESYKIPKEMIHVVKNGVDCGMVATAEPAYTQEDTVNLLYISRPERGLEHLVKVGGVMDRLAKSEGRNYQLYVCCYNNVASHMRDFYESLWRRISTMTNVTNLGFLDKHQLYSYMKACDLLTYPTPGELQPDFVEVSCIAAMEAMHAELPMLTTEAGALPETCKGSGTVFTDIDGFTSAIKNLFESYAGGKELVRLRKAQKEVKDSYDWRLSAGAFETLVGKLAYASFESRKRSTLLKNFILESGISTISKHEELAKLTQVSTKDVIEKAKIKELKECYSFFPLPSYAEHYRAYYEYEKKRGVNYGPESLEHNPRYMTVREQVKQHVGRTAKPIVMDYGCAHGHYTVNLAKAFPGVCFIGVDICADNIEKAKKWAKDDKVDNVTFVVGDLSTRECGKDLEVLGLYTPSLVIAAEVLEHVREPFLTFENLQILSPEEFIITTPFGPWEAEGYVQHWPWRAHIHNFSREVIQTSFGGFKDFNLCCVANGQSRLGPVFGSYVYSFKNARVGSGYELDNEIFLGTPPIAYHSMQETLALVILVGDDWKNLVTCLDSVQGILDEVVVSLDLKNDTTTTRQVLEQFTQEQRIPLTIVQAPDPLIKGFDDARNVALDSVSADWVLWLDSDETLVYKDNIRKYLKTNVHKSYNIPQNHISDDPPGLMTTDYPAKLFRSGVGIKFYGRVHEHPEFGPGKGTGPVHVIKDMSITHLGYGVESTRRKRFFRNLGLLMRDVEDYPERPLNKFFLVRDMAQLLRYQHECGRQMTKLTTSEVISKATKAWKACLATKNIRMISEASRFYSNLVEMSTPSCVKVELSYKFGFGPASYDNRFNVALPTRQEASDFVALMVRLQLEELPDKYV